MKKHMKNEHAEFLENSIVQIFRNSIFLISFISHSITCNNMYKIDVFEQ